LEKYGQRSSQSALMDLNKTPIFKEKAL